MRLSFYEIRALWGCCTPPSIISYPDEVKSKLVGIDQTVLLTVFENENYLNYSLTWITKSFSEELIDPANMAVNSRTRSNKVKAPKTATVAHVLALPRQWQVFLLPLVLPGGFPSHYVENFNSVLKGSCTASYCIDESTLLWSSLSSSRHDSPFNLHDKTLFQSPHSCSWKSKTNCLLTIFLQLLLSCSKYM